MCGECGWLQQVVEVEVVLAGIGLLWAWGGSSHKHLLLLILFMVFSVMGGWAIVYVCGCVCGEAWHSQFQQKRQV